MAHGLETDILLRRISELKTKWYQFWRDGYLSIAYCNLTSLPQHLPNYLVWLNISHTGITVLPKLPNSIKHLDISHTGITVLPPQLPNSLTKLNISHTGITVLPKLPNYIYYLNISNTGITVLPILQDSINHLNISHTGITVLQTTLPNHLRYLDMWHTNITVLPQLPTSLYYLDMSLTGIIILPYLPDSLLMLQCYTTPLLLPRRPSERIKEYSNRWEVWREDRESQRRCKERCKLIKEELMMNVYHPDRVEKLLNGGGWEAFNTLF